MTRKRNTAKRRARVARTLVRLALNLNLAAEAYLDGRDSDARDALNAHADLFARLRSKAGADRGA